MQRGWAAVARLGGVGDNLIAASVCAPLKRMGYKVEVITSEPNHVVFHHNPHIDKLSVKRPGDIPEGEGNVWQKWHETRAAEYDVYAHLSHSCEARHALFQHMTPFWWPQDYRRKICAGSYLETVHDIAGVPYEFGPLFYASEEEKERALAVKAKMGPKVIAWVLSGSRIDKIYPAAALAISRIIKELNVPVMMVGAPTPREFEMAKTIQETVERHNSSLEGLHLALSAEGSETGGDKSWPVRRSLSQTQSCDLVVTPDTGTAWAVAFESIPKVCMVTHASADNITKNWFKTITLHADAERVPCWPCHRLHDEPRTCVANKDDNGAACISDVSVECMLTAVKAGLGDEASLEGLTKQWEKNVTLRGEWKGNGSNGRNAEHEGGSVPEISNK